MFCFAGQSKAWTKEVKKNRANWTGPTKCSVLCSEHFERTCFEEGPLRRQQMGIPTKRPLVLKKGAVPTIFKKASTATTEEPSTSTSTGGKTERAAYVKRERKRVRK